MVNKRLTIWHWFAISFAGFSLIWMLRFTTKVMPSREKGDHDLFIGALSVVQEIDPVAKKTYIADLIEKYLYYPNGSQIGYMEAVEAIAQDYPSPEFKQELDRLRREREVYLTNLRTQQIDAISSTLVAWFLFMAILNGGGFIVIHLIKWGGSKIVKSK